MKRRIFVAIAISEELQKRILEWEKDFQNFPVRWLEGKNLHITLIPPWYEENENIKNQIAKLKNINAKSFEIGFEKVGLGPDLEHPRLIWAEGKAPKEIINLKDELEKIFPEFKSTHRHWLMHLTLARFSPEEFQKQPFEIDEKVDWRDRVDSFVLMESRLSAQGADYEVLQSFKMA